RHLGRRDVRRVVQVRPEDDPPAVWRDRHVRLRHQRPAETRMAGYSGTPLPQKLGIKPHHAVALVNAPAEFVEYLGPLPDGATVIGDAKTKLDVVLLFVTGAAALARQFPRLAKRLHPAGGLWVAWPKK